MNDSKKLSGTCPVLGWQTQEIWNFSYKDNQYLSTKKLGQKHSKTLDEISNDMNKCSFDIDVLFLFFPSIISMTISMFIGIF